MKKIALLGICLLVGTGCGRGFFPRLFHGAPCLGGRCMAPCQTCPTPTVGVNYGGYDTYGDAYGSSVTGVVGSDQIINGGILNDGAIVNDPNSLQGMHMESIGGGTLSPPPATKP